MRRAIHHQSSRVRFQEDSRASSLYGPQRCEASAVDRNVYIINPKVAQFFHDHKIPGIIVTRNCWNSVCTMVDQRTKEKRSSTSSQRSKLRSTVISVIAAPTSEAPTIIRPSRESWRSNVLSLRTIGCNSTGRSVFPDRESSFTTERNQIRGHRLHKTANVRATPARHRRLNLMYPLF